MLVVTPNVNRGRNEGPRPLQGMRRCRTSLAASGADRSEGAMPSYEYRDGEMVEVPDVEISESCDLHEDVKHTRR